MANPLFFKTLEKDLPETTVPDEHLKYILSWILQYVIALIPSNGGLGLITRLLTPQKETGADQGLIKRESNDLEVLIVYTGLKEPTEPSGASFGMPARQTEGMLDFGLRLVDEIVRQNRGMMKFEVDEKTPKTVISFKFPVDRRKVVHYQPIDELTSSTHEFKSTFERLSSLEEIKQGKRFSNILNRTGS